ncbi:MAG: HAD family hydrolase [Bacteroidales bacterium]|nr:HAD family hydrolase [Bacteroidales bacterium]
MIIWDWNGTLLNDVDICLDCINHLLESRNHPKLIIEKYKQIFTFPVQDYYVKAGFDFSREPFDIIAMEFIDLYRQKLPLAKIFPETTEVLNVFKRNHYRQVMISAMEHNSLINSVKEKGLENYFDIISGIGDHFAVSKLENARNIIAQLGSEHNNTWMIGDTCHDFEVANDLGLNCLLVANGHQAYDRIKNSDCQVVEDLRETIRFFKLNHLEIKKY